MGLFAWLIILITVLATGPKQGTTTSGDRPKKHPTLSQPTGNITERPHREPTMIKELRFRDVKNNN